MDPRGLFSAALRDLLDVCEIGQEFEIERKLRVGERIIRHMHVLMISAPDIGVDLNFDCLLDDFPSARLRVSLGAGFDTSRRRQKEIGDRGVRLDGNTCNGVQVLYSDVNPNREMKRVWL